MFAAALQVHLEIFAVGQKGARKLQVHPTYLESAADHSKHGKMDTQEVETERVGSWKVVGSAPASKAYTELYSVAMMTRFFVTNLDTFTCRHTCHTDSQYLLLQNNTPERVSRDT